MADVLFVLAMLALTAVTALFIVGCNKMIGPDDAALAEGAEDEPPGHEPEPHEPAAA